MTNNEYQRGRWEANKDKYNAQRREKAAREKAEKEALKLLAGEESADIEVKREALEAFRAAQERIKELEEEIVELKRKAMVDLLLANKKLDIVRDCAVKVSNKSGK